MRFKSGVNPFGIKPELVIALTVADRIYSDLGENLVVTSLNDSTHSKTSLHYCGYAADIRTRCFHNSDGVAQAVRNKIFDHLGGNPDYDVILEKDHIHIEYQPKYRGA